MGEKKKEERKKERINLQDFAYLRTKYIVEIVN